MSIVLSIGLLVFDLLPARRIPYLLVVNVSNNTASDKIENMLAEEKIKYRVRSKNVSKGNTDIVYELYYNESNDLYNNLTKITGITSFNLLSQDGECQF